ncbi:hypothetical protein B4099_2757 [Heyndrickxia coagulans]|uniref:Uncharacterized protein n=1 Tax=Heyndrickxia coagulans TaxID=1398 RepID=A0A150KKB3_HEYCO|nr:hypothetical protein B4099_2757 [Heyndrickxia coagulans]
MGAGLFCRLRDRIRNSIYSAGLVAARPRNLPVGIAWPFFSGARAV